MKYKNKTVAELIELRKGFVKDMADMVAAGKQEKRQLSAVETRAFEAAKKDIADIDEEMRSRNTTPPTPQIYNEKTPEMLFSLIRGIRSIVNNKPFDAASQAFHDAGIEAMRNANRSYEGNLVLPFEHRAVIQSSAAGSGAEAIATQTLNMIEPLRAALVLVQAGATFLTGLVGDVSIPSYSGSSAAWKGEGAPADDGAGITNKVDMSPKRITAYIDIDKKFLAQDSVGAEALLMADIVNALSGKLEATVFGKEAASATQPGGLFAVAPSIKGAATLKNLIALETAVDTANALVGNLRYITNSKGRGILKGTPKVANQALYLMEAAGSLNGYSSLVTNHVATALQVGGDEEGIVFGNWQDFLIGQWGALDLTIDPYTRAKEAEVRIVINAYFDAVQRRSASFATGSLK